MCPYWVFTEEKENLDAGEKPNTTVPQSEPSLRPTWLAELGNPAGKGIPVAVIDSGWDPELTDNRVRKGTGFVSEDGLTFERSENTADLMGHGIACGVRIFEVTPEGAW